MAVEKSAVADSEALDEAAGNWDFVKRLGGRPQRKRMVLILAGVLVIVLAGVGTGKFLAQEGRVTEAEKKTKDLPGGAKLIESGLEIGIEDPEVFRDSAEGILRVGGIEGEGTHHLERQGGVSQNVYLTSSVLDLDEFVNKKIKVWGETFAAQKAGWLMDVGRVRVIE